MRLSDLFPSFVDECIKIAAARMAPARAAELVNTHHETQDWKRFEKNLNTKAFRQAVLLSPDSDAKLKRYTKTLGEYKSSKIVVGVVPSRTSNKLYKVKQLPNGRLGCSCKDWQYSHSHKKKSDCDHIQELRGGLQ